MTTGSDLTPRRASGSRRRRGASAGGARTTSRQGRRRGRHSSRGSVSTTGRSTDNPSRDHGDGTACRPSRNRGGTDVVGPSSVTVPSTTTPRFSQSGRSGPVPASRPGPGLDTPFLPCVTPGPRPFPVRPLPPRYSSRSRHLFPPFPLPSPVCLTGLPLSFLLRDCPFEGPILSSADCVGPLGSPLRRPPPLPDLHL